MDELAYTRYRKQVLDSEELYKTVTELYGTSEKSLLMALRDKVITADERAMIRRCLGK